MAATAWQEERALRAAWADELRQELMGLFGTNCPVEIDLNAGNRPIARIEGLRFILTKQSENGVETFNHLLLLSNCTRCGKDTGIEIHSLADLGRLLETLDKKPGEYCSRCIGLPRRVAA